MKKFNRKAWTYTAVGIDFNIKERVREVVDGINLPQLVGCCVPLGAANFLN